MKRLSEATVVLLFFAWVLLIGCSQQGGSEERAAAPKAEHAQTASDQPAALPAAEPMKSKAPSEQAAAPRNGEIQGTVVKTEEGIVIFSDKGSYMVAGQDLTGWVGRNVRVTGTIEETEGRSVVTISSVSLIE